MDTVDRGDPNKIEETKPHLYPIPRRQVSEDPTPTLTNIPVSKIEPKNVVIGMPAVPLDPNKTKTEMSTPTVQIQPVQTEKTDLISRIKNFLHR